MELRLDFVLPPEYTSFLYLTNYLGDVGNVKAVCEVWNNLNGWKNNSLRVKSVDEYLDDIVLTGCCINVEQALSICAYVTTAAVRIKYEKTITTISVEV